MNVELAGADWVLPFAFTVQGLSAVLVLLRLVRGPGPLDRVVAIDALTLVGVAVVALVALGSAQAVLLDVAVALALVAFFGTAAFGLLFVRQESGRAAADDGRPQGWKRLTSDALQCRGDAAYRRAIGFRRGPSSGQRTEAGR